ncbi:MAG: hypothetical protein IBX63_10460 [Coriobacteriia bacterium]|nr:hypothetical protein [Coriobacteriia bacterium]
MKVQEVIERFPEALERCLDNVPRSTISRVEREVRLTNGMTADLVVDLKVLGRGQTMLVEAKSSGQPRRTREAIDQLRRMRSDSRVSDAYPVFFAPYVSEASARICREDETGYLDLVGNCRLAFGDSYVERVSPENTFKEQRSRVSVFSPKSSRVIRLMLSESRAWQVQQLASAAEVSLGLVSKVKKELEEREWLLSTEDGIKLADPERVLMEWAKVYSYKKNSVGEYYTMAGTEEAELAIASWCDENQVRYALTGFSGARMSSPRVRYNRSTVYVESKLETVAGVELKPVDTGGNVLLLEPYDQGVFQQSRVLYGNRVVSPVQLYLDLQSMSGRSEEAAEEVLVRELRPSW